MAADDDTKPSKQQLSLLQHHHGIKHDLAWPGPRTPTIVLDQVLLPLSPTDDPLILKVSPRHPGHYYSASPSYRQKTATQITHQPDHRPSAATTRTSGSDTIQHHRLIEISNQDPLTRRNRSMASPATPPKPRIWDEDNAFHAFQVEHAKLGVDLTISRDESPAETSDAQRTRANGQKKHKVSMGHVEIVMSELDKARFKTQQSRNRFQVRYSSDGYRNLEIEETQQNGSSPSPSPGPLEQQSPDPQEHDALPDSGSASSHEHFRTRCRSPIIRHQSHESISSSSSKEQPHSPANHEPEQQTERRSPYEAVEREEFTSSSSSKEQSGSPSNHEAEQVERGSSYEAAKPEYSSPRLSTENRIFSSPSRRAPSSPAADESEEEARYTTTKQEEFSPELLAESRLETPFPADDHPSHLENGPSNLVPTSTLPDLAPVPFITRISPGGFLRESEERQSHASPIDQDASRIDQGGFLRESEERESHASPIDQDATCTDQRVSRINQAASYITQDEPRTEQGVSYMSPDVSRDGRDVTRNPISSQPQVPGVMDSDSDRGGRSDEEIASRLCSVESGYDLPDDRHEESVRPPSPAHRSSPDIAENSQTNPIPISSSASPSVDLPSCLPQSPHRPHSLRSTAELTDSERSDLQSENEDDDCSRDSKVSHRDSQRSERHSSGGLDWRAEQSQDEEREQSSPPVINHSSHRPESSTSGSPEISRLPRPESLPSESQDVDQSVSLDDLTMFKAQGNLKHFTSTPRGVLHHPVPFPAVRSLTAGRAPSNIAGPSASPIVEIVSSDPKVAARAAAILKVHHGFIPRGCKVENTGLIGDDDLEREMELSIQREEADRSLRLHASSTTTSSAHPNPLRTVQAKSMLHQRRTDSSHASTNNLSTETERQETPEPHHHSRPGPSSVPSTTRQSSSRRMMHHSYFKSLKEELQQLNYRPNMLSWSQTDWKILEFCFKRIERKQPLEDCVKPEDVVLKMLEALDLSPHDCQSEWEWTKMIHRVIALQKRRSLDPSRRSRGSSATTPTSHRPMVTRPRSGISRHQSGASGSSSGILSGGPAVPSSVKEEEDVPREEVRGVYPSLEPVRRAFSRSRSSTPLPPCPKDRPGETGGAHSVSPAPSKHRPSIPQAPPISARFRRQSLRNIVAYWRARGPRRVGKGKIWTVVAAFEARFDALAASLLPPPSILITPDTDRPSSSRPNKRGLDSSAHTINPSSASTTTTTTTTCSSSNTNTMFHPSFVNDFYSEHSHLLPTAPTPRSWKKQRKT
ncbi:hypothetical protein PtB15_8B771 [Puccinia triticina]|nr:hypothetical protein PtB15_8B771 [Puccinia triticina]